MKKILIIFGTRPETIKIAPVVKELRKHKNKFEVIVCVTAQHRQMLDQALSLFRIKPDINLDLMQENQNPNDFAAKAVKSLGKVILGKNPDLVLVQGDTTTAMAAALAGFYNKIPIGHIEAGLRTGDMHNPFPEEINRRIITVLSTYHFAPTRKAVRVLQDEGVPRKNIFLTGNTIVDTVRALAKDNLPESVRLKYPASRRLILVTAHRRENFGKPLENICKALKEISKRNVSIEIIYPVHMNPNVGKTVHKILGRQDRIHLMPPLKYDEFIYLLNCSYLVLTDSGGVQEEAPVFGKPVLILRKRTERPEGVSAGVARIIGTDTKDIIRSTEELLCDRKKYLKMSKAISPYGDGKAARRIVRALLREEL